MGPTTTSSPDIAHGMPAPVRRGVRRRKPKVDPDYVPSAGCARPKQLNKRGRRTVAAQQSKQVKLRLRRVKPSIQKTKQFKCEPVMAEPSVKKADVEEADASSCIEPQPCIWQLMAAYCLPPRKRRRHRLEGDLDSFAATQYCHSALSSM